MKAVITVVGKDMVGILAKIANVCASANVNVEDVTQSILQNLFAMIMLVDISKCSVEFSELSQLLQEEGKKLGMDIHITRQELFDAMHHI